MLNAAFSMFMKYGVKSVSMDDIARNLGVSKKTIYSIVDNKKELIQKVFQTFLKQEQKMITNITKESKDSIDEMLNIGRHVIQFMREMKPSLVYDLQKYHPGIWKFIQTEHFSFIEKIILNNIEKGMKSKMYRPEINPEIITKLYMAKSKEIVNEDVFPNQIFSKPELFEQFFIYHLHGIASLKGKEHLNTKISIG